MNEVAGMVAQLGVDVKTNELDAIIRELDKNGSGTIEFEEFQNFLLIDPYTSFQNRH